MGCHFMCDMRSGTCGDHALCHTGPSLTVVCDHCSRMSEKAVSALTACTCAGLAVPVLLLNHPGCVHMHGEMLPGEMLGMF